jgi:hypothetical protein
MEGCVTTCTVGFEAAGKPAIDYMMETYDKCAVTTSCDWRFCINGQSSSIDWALEAEGRK